MNLAFKIYKKALKPWFPSSSFLSQIEILNDFHDRKNTAPATCFSKNQTQIYSQSSTARRDEI
jgi:hypothetical protein